MKVPKLTTIVFLGVLGLAGCKNHPEYFIYDGAFQGYHAHGGRDAAGRHISLKCNQDPRDNCGLSAVDNDDDGRFDKIVLEMPKGHPLERLANPEDLARAWNQLHDEYLRQQARTR